MSNGYLFVAHGQKFVKEAIKASKSIRAIEPESEIAIITNFNKKLPFDYVIRKPDLGGYRSKVEYMRLSPFKNTLFLDTDIYMCGKCEGVFRLMEYFDICMAPAPGEVELREYASPHNYITGAIPFNTGVVLYNKSEAMGRFWESVSDCYNNAEDDFYKNHPNKKKSEQLCFQNALMHTDVRFFGLSSVWNLRTNFFVDICGEVKIIHGRGVDFESMANMLKESNENRCWNPIKKIVQFRRP